MSSTIGDQEDAPQGEAPPLADDGDGIAPWAKDIDWGAVKRETQIMLKLNPNARIPEPEEGDQGDEVAPDDKPAEA